MFLKDCTDREKEKLARIAMGTIIKFLQPEDFGMRIDNKPDGTKPGHIVPLLGKSGKDLIEAYYNKLSPSGKAFFEKWYRVWMFLGKVSVEEDTLNGALLRMKKEGKENGK